MADNAWVTLATNDSYALGAQVLAYSLKKVSTKHKIVVLVTPGVSDCMKEKLTKVFDLVNTVDVLDSKDEANLALLVRPELGVTFTKLHCWKLVQFKKCVFLDADTLVIQNCDDLFERDEFSAAPDVGWPDCFNSGVFVYKPSFETFNALLKLATDQGSFDGGDQGLLNIYFSNWSLQDNSKRLPFIYNLCSIACYSYLPAFKQYGQHVRIFHFIGSNKPWLQHFDTVSCQVQSSSSEPHLGVFLQFWWNIFFENVHPSLDKNMGGLAAAYSQMTLGVAQSEAQAVLEEKLRKEAWEAGHIDYMGRDSFDNILQKITETLSLSDAKKISTSLKESNGNTNVEKSISKENVEAKESSLPYEQQEANLNVEVKPDVHQKRVCDSSASQSSELGPAVLVDKTPEIGPAVLVKKCKVGIEKTHELGPGVNSAIAICPNLTVAEICKPTLLVAGPTTDASQTSDKQTEFKPASGSVSTSLEIKPDIEKSQSVPKTPDIIEATPPTSPLSSDESALLKQPNDVQPKETQVTLNKNEIPGEAKLKEKPDSQASKCVSPNVQNLKIDATVLNTPPVGCTGDEKLFDKEKAREDLILKSQIEEKIVLEINETTPISNKDTNSEINEPEAVVQAHDQSSKIEDKPFAQISETFGVKLDSTSKQVQISLTDDIPRNLAQPLDITLELTSKSDVGAKPEALTKAEVCEQPGQCTEPEVCAHTTQSTKPEVSIQLESCTNPELCPKSEDCNQSGLKTCEKSESINIPEVSTKPEFCTKSEFCPHPGQCTRSELTTQLELCKKTETCEQPEACAQLEPLTKSDMCSQSESSTKLELCAQLEPCTKPQVSTEPESCTKFEVRVKPDQKAQPRDCVTPEVCAQLESCANLENSSQQELRVQLDTFVQPEICTEPEACTNSAICSQSQLCIKPEVCISPDSCTKSIVCDLPEVCAQTNTCAIPEETDQSNLCKKSEECKSVEKLDACTKLTEVVQEKSVSESPPAKVFEEKSNVKTAATGIAGEVKKSDTLETKKDGVKESGNKTAAKLEVSKGGKDATCQKPTTANAAKKKPTPIKGKSDAEKKDASGDNSHPSMPIPPPRKKDPKKAAPKPTKQPPKK